MNHSFEPKRKERTIVIPAEKVITVEMLASEYGVTRKTMHLWINAYEGDTNKVFDNYDSISLVQLVRWLEASTLYVKKIRPMVS